MEPPDSQPNQPNQRNRREMQAEWRRNQLLDVALSLFAARGVENTTIKDIAEAAGVAQGLVYHYFHGKEDLLVQVLRRRSPLPAMRTMLAALQGRPVTEVLPLAVHAIYTLMTDRRDILRLMFREALVNQAMMAHLSDFRDEAVGIVAQYLGARVAAGELRPHNPQTVTMALVGSVMLLRLQDLPPEPYLTDLANLLLHGLLVTNSANPANPPDPA